MSSQPVIATYNMYYLVSQETYERCQVEKQNLDEKLTLYPKKLAKKIKAILTVLAASGLKWNIIGTVQPNPPDFPVHWNILEMTAFCVGVKGREPSYLSSFVNLLVTADISSELVVPKIRKKILKRKREAERAKK